MESYFFNNAINTVFNVGMNGGVRYIKPFELRVLAIQTDLSIWLNTIPIKNRNGMIFDIFAK